MWAPAYLLFMVDTVVYRNLTYRPWRGPAPPRAPPRLDLPHRGAAASPAAAFPSLLRPQAADADPP